MTKALALTHELPGALPLRVVMGGASAEEKRCPSPVHDDPALCGGQHCSPTSDDERSASIPMTADLLPLEHASSEAVQLSIQSLQVHDDWLQQHEAITTLRQCLVHHSPLLVDSFLRSMIPLLVTSSDNLRSALSKNALLALSESFEFLGYARLSQFLQPTGGASSMPLVDVLLRRATCEKRFLREAASHAVDKLIAHLASTELIACASSYSGNKNSKLVAIASRIMAQSFATLKARGAWDVEQFTGNDMRSVYLALAKFRSGKDSAARSESMACLKMLGESLGRQRFEQTLRDALQHHSFRCIVTEVFPPLADSTSASLGRRGSLKDRMLLQQQQR